MEKIYIVRWHHHNWDVNEYEQKVYTDYALARKAYDMLAKEYYYTEVHLYNCVRIITKEVK